MKHILLLEDDYGVSETLMRILEDEEYYVSFATRVADAKDVLTRVKVDLLIADVLLPDGTAFELIDEAKRRGVPYLLMTGSPEHMAQLEANGEFHLSKPFRLANLLGEVRDRIGRSSNGLRN